MTIVIKNTKYEKLISIGNKKYINYLQLIKKYTGFVIKNVKST